ncbi:MAG: hypothetical protein ACE5FD_03795 [Anaerolineae bacterium]
MELVFRPPYQARYGGLVERLFGNLAAQLRERLPGAILQPDQRHWHNASQDACLLYRDIERIIYELVTDYLHTPHRELDGLTPRSATARPSHCINDCSWPAGRRRWATAKNITCIYCAVLSAVRCGTAHHRRGETYYAAVLTPPVAGVI